MDEQRTRAQEAAGRGTSRRTLLAAVGLGAVGLGVAACASAEETTDATVPPTSTSNPSPPNCVLSPEAIEGPYYIDHDLVRSDIREDRQGVPVELNLTVVDAVSCAALPGAVVDIWHCDALGNYSGHLDLDPNEPPTPTPHVEPTDPSTFLRGTQISGPDGSVRFQTIYPGYYHGRSIHLHVLVHVGGRMVHTGQLYLPEEYSARVVATPPYSNRPVEPKRVTNDVDFLFAQQGGAQTTLRMEPLGSDLDQGFRASLSMGVTPDKTPPPATFVPPAN
ncbi:intradiol ring-cleavage dioxygenase [Nocardia sp. NPDC050378]|uniref:intradiol ring-cleavage dioxygenase n=1 Tax=Nocardia sp. NPDC050378 TaxID=3155400 RepID=UPI0033FB5EEE